MALAIFMISPYVNVVHPDGPLAQPDPVQVVHGQDGAALILVADEAKALAFARLVIANQVDVDDFA